MLRISAGACDVFRLYVQVYKFNVPTFGKDVVFDVTHKIRAEQFKMFSEGLKASKMADYVPLFVQEAEVRLMFALCHGPLPCTFWVQSQRGKRVTRIFSWS